MTRFLLKRAITALVVIVGVVTVIFVLSRMIGDPIALMTEPGMSASDVAELRASFHLDEPISTQYARFVGMALHGDFGLSMWQGQPALGLVLASLPATLLLTVSAMTFALVLAVCFGTVAALYPGSFIDRGIMALSLFGQSIPNFWFALMLILVLSTQLHLLPSAGIGGAKHLVMPTIALGLFPLARLMRLVRSGLLEVMAQDYIRTARSKGLSTAAIIIHHCFGNIAISLVTVLAVDFGMLMGGAVVTETIFAWPGMGRLMIQAIGHRDFPIMQAGAFVVAVLVILTNLAADMAYALLNPRIRYE